MIEHDIKVRTRAGQMHAFTARPAGQGPHPAVIFFMDAPGFRPELEDMARRIALAGYHCILPDLYYRMGTIRLDYDRSNPGHATLMMAARNNVTNAMTVDDTAAILTHLDAHPDVKPGKIGIVGHCMSGSFIMTVAARFPDRVAAAAAFYGTRIITDEADSPHLIAGDIKGEVYLSFAETDTHVEDNIADDIAVVLKEKGVKALVEKVPGTEHGYCFAERPAYHPIAAEQAWQKLKALFERALA
ncbi:MAG: dienelactone hydrolase family protein [Hyphomicrobiaceae bacterium]